MKQRFVAFALGTTLAALPAAAQQPTATGVPAARPDYVRTTAPADPILQRMWAEGMERSQAADLAQVLLDSIGPRLTGSPGLRSGNEWLVAKYGEWGIPARNDSYGTWNSWRRGITHIDLISPRVRSLEGMMLGWSPGTGGQPVEGEIVLLPDTDSPEAFGARMGEVKGKWVLISAPQLSCRAPEQWEQFGTPASQARMDTAQRLLTTGWRDRALMAGNIHETMKAAGALGAISMQWSQDPGINKIFGTTRQQVPTFSLSCEDYGLVYRLAEKGQQPRVRITAESEFLGEQPVFNTIAEIKGSDKPDEYVILSAHFDSWDGASGATDNGTGTITMLEAMRILKAVYPNPKRTILVGHWAGEEQGLNGSRAFTQQNPDVVKGVHALFNQDNGTGRVVNMSPGGLVGAGPALRGYLAAIPGDITQHIRFSEPGFPASGGSDHASFACHGAPAFSLGALSWDYGNTTWHTNRDTYDKVVMDDLMNNATLTAMLAYLASEDPNFMPRQRVDPLPTNPRTGNVMTWPVCTNALRNSSEYRR